MKKLFSTIADALRQDTPVVMVSILTSSGSTPREAGAAMLVFEHRPSVGTIGGGAVEHSAELHARTLLAARHSDHKYYRLHPDKAADLGMICGGDVDVYFQYIKPDAGVAELFGQLALRCGQNRNVWLVRRFEGGEVEDMGIYDDDDGLSFAKRMTVEEVKPLLSGNAAYIAGASTSPSYFAEPVSRNGRVLIFGGGHVSQALVPVLAYVGFRPLIFEDRPQFADASLFPAAIETILGDFNNISDKLEIGASDYIAIMTRGHQNDYEVLAHALRSPASYIGLIGSRSKIAATRQRISELGIAPEEFDRRVHTPIGLSIGAETPAEIAISITSEMIAHRAGKDASHG